MKDKQYKGIGPRGNINKIKSSYSRRPKIFRLLNLCARYFPKNSSYRNNSIFLMKQINDNNDFPEMKPDDLVVKWAGDFQLNYIESHFEARHENIYKNRLKRGYRCFCLPNNDEVMGYVWLALHKCCNLCGSDYGHEFFPLKQNQIFAYDLYIFNRYRGQGFGAYLNNIPLTEVSNHNINDIFTLVETSNEISIRKLFKTGV